MPRRSNVVPHLADVTEAEFLNAMVSGLARAQAELGTQKTLAFVMDLSTKQVGNIMAGGSTDPKRLWDAHAAAPDSHVLSDIADLYDCRVVPKGAVCSTDGRLSQATFALLKKAIGAELDGAENHQKLLDMESELREMRAHIDQRLAAIADLRTPRRAA